MSDHIFVLKMEATAAPFKFKAGSKTLSIPHIDTVDAFALADLLAKDHPSDVVFTRELFQAVMGDKFAQLQALHLSKAQLVALFQAYQEHCGTSVGESPASSS